MPNTRDIRNRIKAVKNTAKITRAMQLVAASKMKRAQSLALQGRPYASLMARMLAVLKDRMPELNHPFLKDREVKVRGVLIISTDRGLCGSLNANIFREAASLESGSTRFYTIGKKARQFLARTGRQLVADFPISEGAPFKEFRPVIEMMVEDFKAGKIDSIEVLYSRFKNTLIQEPCLTPFLPLENFTAALEQSMAAEGKELEHDDREILFEPTAAEILPNLLDVFLRREIYQLLLDARASEQSARMVAMKAATDNAKKLTDDLTLQYNKARQAGITQEILEITAAAQSA
jgi:F-type H+-transporting ATPase subunit gamma